MSKSAIKSMTAFAQCQDQGDWGEAVWEIRSVNHRYFDQSIRLPEELRELEPSIRELTRRFVQRGKIDCQLRFKSKGDVKSNFNIDKTLLMSLIELGQEITTQAEDVLPLSLIDILKWPGIINIQELDVAQLSPILLNLYQVGLKKLGEVRQREGQSLKELILDRLQSMQQHIKKLIQQQPAILKAQREQLQQKISEIKVEYDVQRFEQELAYLAQKSDVMEELDRLQTHVNEVYRIIEEGGTVGRQLDFFMQELNREANTTGAKSINAEMTQTVVELKILIEQMREQIQNIE